MELIKINDQKLKIMLTPSDMTQYDLNAERIGEDSEQMHRAFRLLLEEVRRKIGFDFDDRRISVQYFPSREGGCEMFISSILPRASGGEERKKLPAAHTGNALAVRNGRQSSGSFQRDGAYRFDTLGDLLRVCNRLQSIGYIGESAAYRDDRNCYYLLFRTLSSSPFTIPEELAFLVEYGKIENAAMLRLYFREHGSLICAPDAVEKLAELV